MYASKITNMKKLLSKLLGKQYIIIFLKLQ